MLPAMLLAMLLATLWALPAAADHDYLGPVTHAPTRKECGTCHMAFQPGLLPAASWQRVMAGLDRHFGEDASLPAPVAADIERYLVTHAGGRRVDASRDRITEQPWFQRKHRRITPATLARPDIRTASNCTACHPDAERGLYDDD
ncbi:cytochrome C [Rhodovastum atsumiense]|uniref:Cytochrome C n=2 Tax=Rhodovastum atsumiense TaxID=504468 RepID=A0A5M6INS3_9PROT|nr:cytochrome C [Rhodovastum atsumiense]